MLVKSLRNAFAVVVASLALLVGAGAGVGQAAINAPAVTDDYLFSKSLSQFSSLRAQRPYSTQLDWSSDGCSWSPDNPFGFKFLPACHRHDFGYRNYKRQGRFNETTRLRIDNNFKSDLYHQCAGNWSCNRTADLYYQAVREFGAS
ncbi:phospholipase A2-like protein [Saccharothrix carnea]|uniref:Phospholipase A2-like protein n=1 Tax=Saccharothrix carnea TaxID=1280637 RepID=A0A2P8IHY4_SACCR|nr:phospholipase A2-like protein [Saccharothrix carnea]